MTIKITKQGDTYFLNRDKEEMIYATKEGADAVNMAIRYDSNIVVACEIELKGNNNRIEGKGIDSTMIYREKK